MVLHLDKMGIIYRPNSAVSYLNTSSLPLKNTLHTARDSNNTTQEP